MNCEKVIYLLFLLYCYINHIQSEEGKYDNNKFFVRLNTYKPLT